MSAERVVGDGDRPPAPARNRLADPLFFALAIVLVLAAILRFEGLAWGLPNAHHWFSYHPDEVMVLGAAQRVNLFAGVWDPGFYNYGSLLIYIVSVTAQVVDAWAPLHAPFHEMARLTLIGRGWVALFGVATVYMAYLIGRRIAGKRAGVISAACLAVLPMHAVHSHFCTVDVPATFWISVCLYNALRWRAARAALWCGLAAGLAAGTKYNAGLVLLAGWAAVALAREAVKSERARALAVMTAAAAAAFFVSTPGVLFDTAAFLRDFRYEARHVQTGHGLVFVQTGPGWWYHLSNNLWYGVGAFLPVAALLAVAVAALGRRGKLDRERLRPWRVLLAFAVPYFVLISLAKVRFQRYDIPLLPVLAVASGALFASLRARWTLIGAAALLGTLVLAQGEVSTMSAPGGDILLTLTRYQGDPRDAVAKWFATRVRRAVTIGLTTAPWFYSPPFSAANAGPQSRALFDEVGAANGNTLMTPDAEGGTAFAEWPEFVVLSDYEYGDALRLQGAVVPERAADIRIVPVRPGAPAEAVRLTRLWNNVVKRYAVQAVWSPAHEAFGLRWSKRRLPPHDAFYPYPTLIVFHRIDAKRQGAAE
jgi:hypothetical protein